MTVYKLLRIGKDNRLYPLFINRQSPTPFGEWLSAECFPTKGFKEIESYVADGLLAGAEDWLPRRLPFVIDYAFGYLDIGYSLQEAVEHAVEDVREEAAV